MSDLSCEGIHCPLCGADPPTRKFCNEVCPDPILHIWEYLINLGARVNWMESHMEETDKTFTPWFLTEASK